MLTEFYCPDHGLVASTHPVSRVECRCGKECAPKGVTPAQQVKRYLAARRERRNGQGRNSPTRANAGTKRQRAALGEGPV